MTNTANVPIISATGTKGKTTTVAIIADVLQRLNNSVLKVDTTGHFLNGERKSTLEESRASWQLVPSVCPGRYLWEFHTNPSMASPVAVLECSVGCSGFSGLGYRAHDVGIFLNVFEDHLGSSKRLQSKEDIAHHKAFIFERIKNGGYAVFNADDELVAGQLHRVNTVDTALIPVGMTFSHFDIKDHLANGGIAVTYRDKKIVILSDDDEQIIADVTKLPWTFNGQYLPSVFNLMHSVAALYGYYKGNLPEGISDAIEAVRLDPYGGRLTVLAAENGATIIADYAHEKVSLKTIAGLARGLTGPGGKVIGVVRLAYDRSDQLIRETGEIIAKNYDHVVVYDKIDGHFKQPKEIRGSLFKQEVGYTSSVLAEGIKQFNDNVERIIREDHALERAAEIAQPNDVVIVIVNDDIKRSIGFIKDSFKADFS